MLPQWQVKDPGHSVKSAGGRLHLNTHTPLTQRSRNGLTMPLAGHKNLSGNELTRNLSENIRLQSSHLAEPLWANPGLKSGIKVHELISTLRRIKKKRAQARNELSNILPESSIAKTTATTIPIETEDRRRLQTSFGGKLSLNQRATSYNLQLGRTGSGSGVVARRSVVLAVVSSSLLLLLLSSSLFSPCGRTD